MITTILTILKSRLGQLLIVGLIGLGGGAYVHHRLEAPTTTTTVVHDVQQVRVEVPTLTTKIVDRIITDPKQQLAINKLIKENNDLKLKLIQVSSTVAEAHSTGGSEPSNPSPGTITPAPLVRTMPTTNEGTTIPTNNENV